MGRLLAGMVNICKGAAVIEGCNIQKLLQFVAKSGLYVALNENQRTFAYGIDLWLKIVYQNA